MIFLYLFARKNHQGDKDKFPKVSTILHRFNEVLGCTISHFALIAVLDNILGLQEKHHARHNVFESIFLKPKPAHQFGFFKVVK